MLNRLASSQLNCPPNPRPVGRNGSAILGAEAMCRAGSSLIVSPTSAQAFPVFASWSGSDGAAMWRLIRIAHKRSEHGIWNALYKRDPQQWK